MLKIRLQRIGRRNDPSFRAVVVDSRQGPKSGKYVERVGSYDPRSDRVSLDGERICMWIEKGAQVSDTLHNLLVAEKVIDAEKKNVLPKKTPVSNEESGEGKSEKRLASAEASTGEAEEREKGKARKVQEGPELADKKELILTALDEAKLDEKKDSA
jgi:small subunit ribosomal protein S16